jgi:hypothetical protein
MSLDYVYNTYPSIYIREPDTYTTLGEGEEPVISTLISSKFGERDEKNYIPWEEDKNFNLGKDRESNDLEVDVIMHNLYTDGNIINVRVNLSKIKEHFLHIISENRISMIPFNKSFAYLGKELSRFQTYLEQIILNYVEGRSYIYSSMIAKSEEFKNIINLILKISEKINKILGEDVIGEFYSDQVKRLTKELILIK